MILANLSLWHNSIKKPMIMIAPNERLHDTNGLKMEVEIFVLVAFRKIKNSENLYEKNSKYEKNLVRAGYLSA